nr:blue copper protein [Quercus suber]
MAHAQCKSILAYLAIVGSVIPMCVMESDLIALVKLRILNHKEEALATQHVVGGSQGWDESTDFNSWTSGQTFKVGDQLVFKYTTGLHSVVELASESAYKNCDLGTALDSKSSGSDVIKLNKAGTRYFACGTLGHCSQGMKCSQICWFFGIGCHSVTPSGR